MTTATVEISGVVMVPIESLRQSPENEALYRPVDDRDADVRALAKSIRQHGVIEPLVITEDHFILSGHRRLVAAGLAGLDELPCRIEPIRWDETDADEIVRLLREHNRQRVKSLDELLREEVVAADPIAAHGRLLEHRREIANKSANALAELRMGGRRRRNGISARKRAMLEAVIRVIGGRREYWPLSVRQVHYCLLNNPPLRNSSKPDSTYANDQQSYADLSDILTRARLAGYVEWAAIHDETRPVTQWCQFANAQDFIRRELRELFAGYARDLQRTQPRHIEIVAEKLTVKSIVESVASTFGITASIGRGYSSVTLRAEMAERFRLTGKETLVVLILSDFDPDGEVIAESFARSMRDDFDIADVYPVKVALTAAQVKDLNLPPQLRAKKTSAHYAGFKRRHGTTQVHELEAVAPEILQQILREACQDVMDLEAYEREVEAERDDAAFLETARQRAVLALRGMDEDME